MRYGFFTGLRPFAPRAPRNALGRVENRARQTRIAFRKLLVRSDGDEERRRLAVALCLRSDANVKQGSVDRDGRIRGASDNDDVVIRLCARPLPRHENRLRHYRKVARAFSSLPYAENVLSRLPILSGVASCGGAAAPRFHLDKSTPRA